MWPAIIQQLSEQMGKSFHIVEKEKVHGGDINQCFMLSDGIDRYFVKVNQRQLLSKFEAEVVSLRIMRETNTVQVPDYLLHGISKNHAYLVLNYLPIKPLDDAKKSYQLGVELAHLHRWGEQKEFGFDIDNYIGTTVQPNPWHKKWPLFFAEQRIGWQLQLLQEKGIVLINIDEFVELIKQRLANHSPRPSLLHGDLWFGNVAHSVNGPLCFDPACYWGDRECDIALAEYFGGFQPEFFQGYESIWPLDWGYEERKDIYNLYHLLNHYNQFGGHYLAEAQKLIDKILTS